MHGLVGDLHHSGNMLSDMGHHLWLAAEPGGIPSHDSQPSKQASRCCGQLGWDSHDGQVPCINGGTSFGVLAMFCKLPACKIISMTASLPSKQLAAVASLAGTLMMAMSPASITRPHMKILKILRISSARHLCVHYVPAETCCSVAGIPCLSTQVRHVHHA